MTTKNKTRIVVCGIGGIGGYYGGLIARLAETDQRIEIDFVARAGKHLDRIKQKGLMVETLSEEFVVRAHAITDDPAQLQAADYIILATKSYDLAESIQSLTPLFHSGTVVLPLLNGLDVHDELATLLPLQVIRWGGCAFITVRKVSPGLIRSDSTLERLVMGDPNRPISSDRTTEEIRLRDIMTRAGIHVLVPDDVMGEVRKKYLMLSNIAAATAYFDCNVDIVLRDHRDFLIGLTKELVALYAAKGYSVETDAIHAALRRIDRMPKQSTTSMHADIIAGHNSELDSLVGYVVTQSERHGFAAPYYREAYIGISHRLHKANS